MVESPAESASADEMIVQSASMLKCPVATNDMKLERALRTRGIPVLFMRKDRSIQAEGAVDYA